MNVKELIERLQQMPQDMPVYVTTEDACGYDDASVVSVVDCRDVYPAHVPFVLIEGS